jgi:hypothetical protein
MASSDRITSPDRTIIVPATYMGQIDAVLALETGDGESGTMELSVAGTIVARGEGFGAAQIGPSLLEMSDEALASMFGAFLAHALESSEPDARDGWPILADEASDWTYALADLADGI